MVQAGTYEELMARNAVTGYNHHDQEEIKNAQCVLC